MIRRNGGSKQLTVIVLDLGTCITGAYLVSIWVAGLELVRIVWGNGKGSFCIMSRTGIDLLSIGGGGAGGHPSCSPSCSLGISSKCNASLSSVAALLQLLLPS
jgi:hypothetical protein